MVGGPPYDPETMWSIEAPFPACDFRISALCWCSLCSDQGRLVSWVPFDADCIVGRHYDRTKREHMRLVKVREAGMLKFLSAGLVWLTTRMTLTRFAAMMTEKKNRPLHNTHG